MYIAKYCLNDPSGDCSDSPPGVTIIGLSPISTKKVPVYCAEDGWTVIQSRGQFGNPVDYFYRGFSSYEEGFGVPGKIVYREAVDELQYLQSM